MWSGPFCSAILQCLSLSLSDDSNHSYASRAPFTYLSGVRRPAKRGMRSQALLIHVIVIFFPVCRVHGGSRQTQPRQAESAALGFSSLFVRRRFATHSGREMHGVVPAM